MSNQSMVAGAGGGSTVSVSRRPTAMCRGLTRTLSAPPSRPLLETHRTQEFPPARPPAAGEIHGDEERQRTPRPGGLAGGCDGAEEKDKAWLKEMRGSLLVVASLLASVTYQAGMNPPGGLWQDSSPEGSPKPHHRAGDPVLQDTDATRFTLFNIFNSFAFAYSVGTMMQLISESVVAGWLGVAFAAGSCRNWGCSLGASSPLFYFLSCVAFDLLYYFFTRRQQRQWAPQPAPQQVELAVEHNSGLPSPDATRSAP